MKRMMMNKWVGNKSRLQTQFWGWRAHFPLRSRRLYYYKNKWRAPITILNISTCLHSLTFSELFGSHRIKAAQRKKYRERRMLLLQALQIYYSSSGTRWRDMPAKTSLLQIHIHYLYACVQKYSPPSLKITVNAPEIWRRHIIIFWFDGHMICSLYHSTTFIRDVLVSFLHARPVS